jgi:hypothetical protein
MVIKTVSSKRSMRIKFLMSSALALAVMLPAQASLTVAAAPTDTGTPGIRIDPNGPRTPAEMGYSQAYADAKLAKFDSAMKTRMIKFSATGGIAPEVASTPGSVMPMDSSSNSIGAFTEYHQKTQSWCLPATAQSVLSWNFGSATWVPGGNVQQGQQNLVNTIGNYSDDATVYSYINGQFSSHGSGFRYVAVNDKSSLSGFEGRITTETDLYREPLYVRVDVSSPYYAWTQSKSALHATVSVGYSSYGASTMIGDPYVDAAHTNGCIANPGVYPGYGSSSNTGCIYNGFSSSNYWQAMSGVVSGEKPEYY